MYYKRNSSHVLYCLKPNTHRRRRRDLTVELSCVGGVNAPVGSRDPVYNFLSSCVVELLRLVTSDDIITLLLKKVININQNSRS